MYPVAGEKSKHESLFDGSYEILTPVGRGRNSIVYRARRLDLRGGGTDEIVALKVLVGAAKHPELNLRRTKREAIAMLSSVHPNVIKLKDYVAREDLCYLSMEFAERGDLKETLDRQKMPFASDMALKLMQQMLLGLEAIHRAGIIHRDIKPENLLLTEDCSIKIADFGIAFLPTERVAYEEANRGIGTFDYLAPECLEEGVSNEATDVYSAAVVCYQLVTGELPFAGESFTEQINNKMHSSIIPMDRFISNPPELLQEFLAQALHNDTERRFKNASAFREAIEAFIEGRWEPAREPQAPNAFDHYEPFAKDDELEIVIQGEAEESAPPEEIVDDLLDDTFHSSLDEDLFLPRAEHSADEHSATELSDEPFFTYPGAEPGFSEDQAMELPEDGIASLDFEEKPAGSRWKGALLVKLILALLLLGVVAVCLRHPQVKAMIAKLTEKPAADSTPDVQQGSESTEAPEAPVDIAPEQGGQAVTDVPPAAQENSFGSLSRGAHAGVLKGFLADNQAVTLFSEVGTGNREVIIGLSLAGWEPVVISSAELSDKKELELKSGGIKLQLKVEAQPPEQGSILGGTYIEQVSGREGTWAIW